MGLGAVVIGNRWQHLHLVPLATSKEVERKLLLL